MEVGRRLAVVMLVAVVVVDREEAPHPSIRVGVPSEMGPWCQPESPSVRNPPALPAGFVLKGPERDADKSTRNR